MNRKSSKFLAMTLSTISVLTLLAGCSGGNSASTSSASVGTNSGSASAASAAATNAAGKDIVVGVLQKNLSDSFQQKLNSAVTNELTSLQNQGKIKKFVNLNGNSDVQTQLNEANDLIAQKVNVIIMAAQDANGCAPIIVNAKEANIPIVVLSTKTTNVNDANAFVGSDDVVAGQMQANYVVDQLGGKGKAKGNILVLDGVVGQSAQIDRTKGIANVLATETGLKKLTELTANWQRDQAMSTTQDWLQKYSKIDAIIAENDDMAVGAVNAVKNANRKGITIIGCDAIADALNEIQEGNMSATLFQDAKGQGTNAADVAYKLATGGTVDKTNLIPFQVVTKDNVAKYIAASK